MQTWVPFEDYPVYGAQIRQAAEETRNRTADVKRLLDQLQAQHRRALTAVAGDLEGSVANAPVPSQVTASAVMKTTVYAAGCLETFADAIDTYDSISTAPRSVQKLNQAYLDGLADNFAGYPFIGPVAPGHNPPVSTFPSPFPNPFPNPLTPPSPPPMNFAGRQRCIASLQYEYHQLGVNLDTAAAHVKAMLQRGPNAADIRSMWVAGNLPSYATVVYPDLLLRATDLKALPVELSSMTPQQLAAYLAQLYTTNPSLYEVLAALSPAAVAVMKRNWANWTLGASGNRYDYVAASKLWPFICMNPDQFGGIVTGPDGREYPVVVPGPAAPCTTTCIRSENGIQDGGTWQTVQTTRGDIALGAPIDAGLKVAFFLAGTAGAGPIAPSQSIGADQNKYLQMWPTGEVTVNDGTQPRATELPDRPPIPDDEPNYSSPNIPSVSAGALDTLMGGLSGLASAQQAENARHYAYQVVFQQDAQGVRRAVILLDQLQSDGKDVWVEQGYARIDSNGKRRPRRVSHAPCWCSDR